MADEPEDADYEEACRLSRALIDLNRRIAGINDEDALRDAHAEGFVLEAALGEVTGVLPRRRQRIVATAANLPAYHHPATTKGVDAIFRKGGHAGEQRYAVARILLDNLGVLLGGKLEHREAARLLLAALGYVVPGDDKATGIRQATVRERVNPAGGLPATLRLSLYNALGYSLGAEGRRDCPPSAWKQRAVLHLRCAIAAHGGSPGMAPGVGLERAEKVVAAAWADIEDESKDHGPNSDPEVDPSARTDLSERAVFRSAWRQGDADRRRGRVNKSLMLLTR
jgi:hypothetical protein